jgi:polyferredoxin
MIVQFLFFLAFPILLNLYSPYVIIDGAAQGIATGSFILFCALFVSSLFFGRLFCSWLCPAGFIQDTVARSRTKKYDGRARNLAKWLIWLPWLALIVALFARAGGIKALRPFHLMESGVSVDQPLKFVTYYGVVLLFFGFSFLGKRAACHSVCWMAPFTIISTRVSKALRLPRLRLEARAESCSSCGACSSACPMSLDVRELVKAGDVDQAECIHCGRCVDGCAHRAVLLRFGRSR